MQLDLFNKPTPATDGRRIIEYRGQRIKDRKHLWRFPWESEPNNVWMTDSLADGLYLEILSHGTIENAEMLIPELAGTRAEKASHLPQFAGTGEGRAA